MRRTRRDEHQPLAKKRQAKVIPEPEHSVRYEISSPNGTYYTPSKENCDKYIRCFQRNHPGQRISAVEISETRIILDIPTTNGKKKSGRRKQGGKIV